MATNTYVALDKKTVTGSAAASVEFLAIPSTYTDLVIVINGQVTSNVTVACQINGDTGAHYSTTEMFSDGTYLSGFQVSNNAQIAVMGIGAQVNSGTQWNSVLNFLNYANTTTYKSVIGRTSATATGVNVVAALWRGSTGSSKEAITSIKLLGYAGASSFTVGTTFSLYGVKAWEAEATPKATGGYVYSDSTYWYHAFPFTSTFTPNQSLTCDYLVIAGGGGGVSGGGGAGGLRSTLTATGGGGSLPSPLSLSASAYTITVGAGGAQGFTDQGGGATGTNGGASSIAGAGITTVTTVGGGAGGQAGAGTSTQNGIAGGSGGGAAASGASSHTGGTGTTNEGFAGGNNGGYTSSPYGVGGGGGAAVAGATPTGTFATAGGAGLALSVWSNATLTGVNSYYAGGGGGGAYFANSTYYNVGGVGGGGMGARGGTTTVGTPGVVSTGSGGGGGGNAGVGANGGSGLVVIRYAK